MFGLVHFIEDFEMEKYLTEMPKALPKMVENAKRVGNATKHKNFK